MNVLIHCTRSERFKRFLFWYSFFFSAIVVCAKKAFAKNLNKKFVCLDFFFYLYAMILKAIKYRLYPTKLQAELLDKHIGACRFIYNLALETKQVAWASAKVNLSCFDLHAQLPELKKECPWLVPINAQSLQAAISSMDSAYTNFFKGKSKFPKFRNKRTSNKSFTVPQRVEVSGRLIKIPKFQEGIKAKIHRKFEGKTKSGVVSKTSTGKYFISVLFETPEDIPVKPRVTEENTIGIDLGIKTFATLSDGQVIENPRHLKKELSKLKYTQRKYSKYKGKRTKQKLARLHEKVTNRRNDFLHKVTKKLIDENQAIALETLNVDGMMKNHKLAQAIQDVSWGRFNEFLNYKAEWYGASILRIGQFDPSSKMCYCGVINKELKLSDREWVCKFCGSINDRDLLAAKNIKKFALRNYVSREETQNHDELPTLVGVLTREAEIQ